MSLTVDIAGDRFGAIVAIRPTGEIAKSGRVWIVRCDCGREARRTPALLRRRQKLGNQQSCGDRLCPHRVRSPGFLPGQQVRLRHGAKRRAGATPEYNTWCKIISRCHDPRDKRFEYYGARGITVCERWRGEDGFVKFLADMGKRPPDKSSIDRKDNALGYSPNNCEWSTSREQNRNKRSNRLVTIGAETMCVTDWSLRNGIPAKTAFSRIYMGWDLVAAVTTPLIPPQVSGPRGVQARKARSA